MRIRTCSFLLLLSLLFFGCAGRYFHDAGSTASFLEEPVLTQWPYAEYWTGIVFNGAKIGFSHVAISRPDDGPTDFNILSEAAFRIRFLLLDKTVALKSRDRVDASLRLQGFDYDYNLDGNRLKLSGRVVGDRLELAISSREETVRQSFKLDRPLYPASIVGTYPVLHGLAVGRTYAYSVYDGQSQTIADVWQEVLAYETSKLFEGAAFKLRTRMHGQEVMSWIDAKGRPVLEMSQHGLIISYLENESEALKYLTQAAVNKDENLLEFSRIEADLEGFEPEAIAELEIGLSLPDEGFRLPCDGRQQCRLHAGEQLCRIRAAGWESSGQEAAAEKLQRFLQASLVIPSRNERIRRTAAQIVSKTEDAAERVGLLLGWIRENIRPEAADVFTALDVLDERKAECQGHAYLYTAFARSLGIPSRVVNGIVYSPSYKGFLYHTWAESFIAGRWLALDPVFGQLPADATHIKFLEGENVSDLVPLIALVGRVKARILAVKGK